MGTNNDYYYDVPWTRAPPYLIGIYCGWLLKTTEGSSNRPVPKVMEKLVYNIYFMALRSIPAIFLAFHSIKLDSNDGSIWSYNFWTDSLLG